MESLLCHHESVKSIPDPLAIDDVHLTLPTGDVEASTRIYDHLLGPGRSGRWSATNGSIGLAGVDAPLTVDLRVADLAGAADLVQRRGVAVDHHSDAASLADLPPLRLTALDAADPAGPMIDHVVLTVADADSAVATFGGRLGINLRLVRDLGKGVSQLFFRTSTAVLEVVAGSSDPADGIALMGVAWRSADIVAERERLVQAGLNVSEVRTGRKAGTQVCTVREPALGTATLLIQQ